MNAELERELRERLQRATLPGAPDRLRASLESVVQAPVDQSIRRTRHRGIRLLAVAALIATGGLAIVSAGGRMQNDLAVFPGPTRSSSEPSPPSPATLTPSVRAIPFFERALEPGTYRLPDELVPVIVTVPEGWRGIDPPGVIYTRPDTPTQVQLHVTSDVTHVFKDICDPDREALDAGGTADDLAELLIAQPSWDVAERTPIIVGGYEGVRIELRAPADLDTRPCARPGEEYPLWVWKGAKSGSALIVTDPDRVDVLYAVDVDGQRIVIYAWLGPEATAANLAELEAIVDSVEFDVAKP